MLMGSSSPILSISHTTNLCTTMKLGENKEKCGSRRADDGLNHNGNSSLVCISPQKII